MHSYILVSILTGSKLPKFITVVNTPISITFLQSVMECQCDERRWLWQFHRCTQNWLPWQNPLNGWKTTNSFEQMENNKCHRCFDAVGWAAGRASSLQETEWWDAGMVICLGQGTDLHMAQLMPLPLTISCSSKSRFVLPFWCRLTRVVPNKIQEGRKTIVCVCVCVCVWSESEYECQIDHLHLYVNQPWKFGGDQWMCSQTVSDAGQLKNEREKIQQQNI